VQFLAQLKHKQATWNEWYSVCFAHHIHWESVKSSLCYAHKLDFTKNHQYRSAEGENGFLSNRGVIRLSWEQQN
jgi:hypothetical protein